jgi:hypothetical protein
MPGQAREHRAQPSHGSRGTARVGFGLLRPPRASGQGTEPPRPTLLLGAGEHVALPFAADLAGYLRIRVHLFTTTLPWPETRL